MFSRPQKRKKAIGIVNSREFYACTYDQGSWSFAQRGMVFFFNKENSKTCHGFAPKNIGSWCNIKTPSY